MDRSRGDFLGVKAPGGGAKKSAQLRYVRDLELRLAAITLVLLLLAALAVGGGFPLVIALVGAVFYATHTSWLTLRAKRLQQDGM